jgi:hypothetical protein
MCLQGMAVIECAGGGLIEARADIAPLSRVGMLSWGKLL